MYTDYDIWHPVVRNIPLTSLGAHRGGGGAGEEYTKQIMHNAIAHHPQTITQAVPKQKPLASFPPSLYTEYDILWYGISLWPVWVPAVLPSNFLYPAAFSLVG